MIFTVRLYRIKRILKEQVALFVSIGVLLVLFSVVFLFYMRFNTTRKEVDLMNNEVNLLKRRYDTLKYNKSLTQDQIIDYNKLLASLVPETEDFFSIIYALEEVSSVSKFNITTYVIDVGNTTNERIVLSVEGSGNPDSFLTFLQEYQFAGGRLITSDKIQYGGGSSQNTRVTLTFYNKRFTFNESVQVPQFSKEELAALDVINKKVKFEFSSSGYQTINTDYPINTNPFIRKQ